MKAITNQIKRAIITIATFLFIPFASYSQENYKFSFLDTLHSFSFDKGPSLNLLQPDTKFEFEEIKFIAPTYEPKLITDELPLHLGEFSASGVLFQSARGTLSGVGRQDNYIGLGIVNSVSFIYSYELSDRASLSAYLNATKLSAFRGYDQFFGTGALFSYQLRDNLTFNAFGNYTRGRFFDAGNFGAYMSLDMTPRFGVDVGAQRFYDPMRLKWDTTPIVAPYYKINKKVKLGMDFGPMLLDAVRSWVK